MNQWCGLMCEEKEKEQVKIVFIFPFFFLSLNRICTLKISLSAGQGETFQL